jgi:hypothetical protein
VEDEEESLADPVPAVMEDTSDGVDLEILESSTAKQQAISPTMEIATSVLIMRL